MKLRKLKNILAIVIVCLMLLAFTGCNKINRPDGAKNNSTDNSTRLQSLLVKDELAPDDGEDEDPPADDGEDEDPPADDDGEDEDPPADDGGDDEDPPVDDGGDDEDPPADDPVTGSTPFDAPGDVITKINAILGELTQETVDANSATGVKDELMTSRTVSVYMPERLFDGQDDAIGTIAANLNMNIDVRIIPDDYSSYIRRQVLAGNKADLMYVDQETWGYSQHYTQNISKFVNFSIADELGTFSTMLSQKFAIGAPDDAEFYVASGISAPYMLVYNKNNIALPTTVLTGDTYSDPTAEEESTSDEVVYKDVTIKDPVEMFNEGTWGVQAFTEILKASTTTGRVGLVSYTNDDRNIDMWFGMEDNAGFSIDLTAHGVAVDTSLVANEGLEYIGKNMDYIQSLYWSQTGVDNSNYVANFVDIGHGTGTIDTVEKQNTLDKVLGIYKGSDMVSSFSFMPIDISEYADVMAYAKSNNVQLDFVPVPYGYTVEQAVRMGEADEEGYYYDADSFAVETYAASMIGGFSVLKTCENPSVALRVAEEITKAWKNDFEASVTSTMTEDQQARYAKMKEAPGVSFFRSIVSNVESGYHATNGADLTERLTADQRVSYQAMQPLSAKGTLMQPMYAKNSTLGSYVPQTFTKWSEFFYGKVSDIDEVTALSGSLLPALSAAYYPATMLFNE